MIRPYNTITKILFLIFAFHLSAQAFAANVQITNILRASATANVGSTTAAPTVYGGIVGDPNAGGCATPSTTSTCNNCVYQPGTDLACNKTRVHDTLIMRIEFTVTAEVTGTLHFGYSVSGGNTVAFASTDYTGTTGTLSKGSTGFIEVPWEVLCDVATGLGNCSVADEVNPAVLYVNVENNTTPTWSNAANINLQVIGEDDSITLDTHIIDCASGNGTDGICSFEASPGDEKVYIDNLSLDNGCSGFTKARVFFSAAGFADATYGGDSVDLDLDTNCAPKGEWFTEGLVNETPYFFRISVVDIAGNNMKLTDIPGGASSSLAACTVNVAPVGFADDDACTTIATPGLVNGLLPEDLNCFIATAAYGAHYDAKLKILRQFRNTFLQTTAWGREFIHFYYKHGPVGAKFIAQHETLRQITRVALLPVVGFAWMSMHYGVSGTMIILLTLIVLTIFGVREWRHGKL